MPVSIMGSRVGESEKSVHWEASEDKKTFWVPKSQIESETPDCIVVSDWWVAQTGGDKPPTEKQLMHKAGKCWVCKRPYEDHPTTPLKYSGPYKVLCDGLSYNTNRKLKVSRTFFHDEEWKQHVATVRDFMLKTPPPPKPEEPKKVPVPFSPPSPAVAAAPPAPPSEPPPTPVPAAPFKAVKGVYDLELTPEQEAAVEVARDLTEARQKGGGTSVGVLTGYAGTGKTTVIKYINHYVGQILVITPTGKAATRVTEATGLPAMTIHRWLYHPTEGAQGEIYFDRKKVEEIERPASGLIVIDEASMVDKEVWTDVLETAHAIQCNVLCVGDPFQLPPVSNDKVPFSILAPDFPADFRVSLTKIQRQAEESPIIRASMLVREGRIQEAISYFYIHKKEELPGIVDWLTQNDGVAICYTNDTRHWINAEVRKRRGYGEELVDGEPLLILKNCYESMRYNGEVVPFGGWRRLSKETYEVRDKYKPGMMSKTKIGLANLDMAKVYLMDAGVHGRLDLYNQKFLKFLAYQAGIDLDIHNPRAFPLVFAHFGYALTCHKSQGSEWKNVLVNVDRPIAHRLHREEGQRWLYTAITRAKERVAFHIE